MEDGDRDLQRIDVLRAEASPARRDILRLKGSEAGSYLRLIDCVHHSTLGLRAIQKKKKG